MNNPLKRLSHHVAQAALAATFSLAPTAHAEQAVVIDVVRMPPRVGVGMAPVFYVPRVVTATGRQPTAIEPRGVHGRNGPLGRHGHGSAPARPRTPAPGCGCP